MKKQITMSELKSLIKEEAMKLNRRALLENEKKSLLKELRTLNEGLSEISDEGNYYFAIAPMDEPGEAEGHIISQEEVSEYEDNGWMVKGPYSEEEASAESDKLHQSNRDFRYYDNMDDREGISNLYIDPLNKFERDSLDTNW
jgi:hypothetical protein